MASGLLRRLIASAILLTPALGVATGGIPVAAGSSASSSNHGAALAQAQSGPVVQVPAAVDATGTSDASAPLLAFLATVVDGSTIEFPAGAVYRLDAGLKFSDRHGLTFAGNGATLRANGGTTEVDSLFALWGDNTDIVIRDFNLVGNSPTPGVFIPNREGAHGVLVDGGSRVDVSGVTISGTFGDAFYVGSWADGVTFHDSTVHSTGRNGLTITSGRNVTVERVTFERSGYCAIDIEPNLASEGASNVRFANNTIGSWGNLFAAADGAPGSVVDGLTITGNTVTSGSLATDVTLARRSHVTFTDNVSKVTAKGPVLRFRYVDGLTIAGNVQALSGGNLADVADSSAVDYRQDQQVAAPPPLGGQAPLPVMVAGVAIVAVLLGIALAWRISRRSARRGPPSGSASGPTPPGPEPSGGPG